MQLQNKVVVITGSSKGLGRSLAKEFAKNGAIIVINGRNKKELDVLAKEIGAFAVVADVSKENEVINFKDQIVKKFGKIDIWINNAGLRIPHASVEQTDWSRVQNLIGVNLFGTVYGSVAALQEMKKQNLGIIINILSTSALEGRAGSSGYCASKCAADGFTKSLRKEIEGSGIKVISIYPGGMQTNFFDEQKPDALKDYMDPDSVASKIIDNILKENPEEEQIIKRPSS